MFCPQAMFSARQQVLRGALMSQVLEQHSRPEMHPKTVVIDEGVNVIINEKHMSVLRDDTRLH